MRNRSWYAALLLILGSAALFGCGEDPLSPASSTGGADPAPADRQAIEEEMAATPELYEDAGYASEAEDEIPFEGSAAGAGTLSPQDTHPEHEPRFHFFRRIVERSREIVIRIQQEDGVERAHVSVTEKRGGTFNIVFFEPGDTEGSFDRLLVQKRLRDLARRQAVFVRRTAEEMDAIATEDPNRHRRWRLAGISHVRIVSPEHTAAIRALGLRTESGLEAKIEDPLALRRFPHGLPKVLPGEPIQVIAYLRDPSDLAFLQMRHGRQRMRPVPDQEGVFVGAFRAPDRQGPFHFAVNALDRGTIFDREAPYDSDFWGVLALAVATRDEAAAD